MGIKAFITGASGMVGQGVLLECLDSDRVEQVLTLNRRSLGIDHPKHREIIVEDFMNFKELAAKFKGYDSCFFCLGISAVGLTEEEYTRITHDLTLHFAEVFINQNPNSTFCYVSGDGTDATEKSRMMWARVKGRTENDLSAMPFESVHHFRPGFIQPLRGIRSRTAVYRLLYVLFTPLYQVLRHFPASATNTTHIGLAMIAVAEQRPKILVFTNRLINQWAKR